MVLRSNILFANRSGDSLLSVNLEGDDGTLPTYADFFKIIFPFFAHSFFIVNLFFSFNKNLFWLVSPALYTLPVQLTLIFCLISSLFTTLNVHGCVFAPLGADPAARTHSRTTSRDTGSSENIRTERYVVLECEFIVAASTLTRLCA